MGLIKSNLAPAALQTFSMKDVEEAAKMILLRARREAEGIVAAARAEAEQLRLQAGVDGHREGLKAGLDEGLRQGLEAGQQQALEEHREQLTATVTALAGAASEIDTHRLALEADVLREVVQLAAAIARRVTRRQGVIDEEVLVANLADALRLVVQAADVRIAIHPGQRDALEQALPQLRIEWPALKHVEIVTDTDLAPGGCRVFTRHGQVNADLDEQLDRIIDELLPPIPDAMGGSPSSLVPTAEVA